MLGAPWAVTRDLLTTMNVAAVVAGTSATTRKSLQNLAGEVCHGHSGCLCVLAAAVCASVPSKHRSASPPSRPLCPVPRLCPHAAAAAAAKRSIRRGQRARDLRDCRLRDDGHHPLDLAAHRTELPALCRPQRRAGPQAGALPAPLWPSLTHTQLIGPAAQEAYVEAKTYFSETL